MPSALEIFRTLCADLSAAELLELKANVRGHYDRLLLAQRREEFVAVDLAEQLCVRLEGLLAMAHQLVPAARGQIVGAARYFISKIDAVPDEHPCTGLDDDVSVFNHVVLALDRPDLIIRE